jgi:hypothetical protein
MERASHFVRESLCVLLHPIRFLFSVVTHRMFKQLRPIQFTASLKLLVHCIGAGNGTRTRINGLEGRGNSLYTIPARFSIWIFCKIAKRKNARAILAKKKLNINIFLEFQHFSLFWDHDIFVSFTF